MSIEGTSLYGSSGIMDAGTFATPNALSPESLMVYLQTRLGGLDDQINTIFSKQKKIEEVRKALMEIQKELTQLAGDKSTKGLQGSANPNGEFGTAEYEKNINAAIDAIEQVDPQLAQKIRSDLGEEGQILYCQDGKYFTAEVGATQEYVNGLVKQLESSAQLEMIQLQSLMSARGTAIQLATNMVNAMGEGPKTIAGNIGR